MNIVFLKRLKVLNILFIVLIFISCMNLVFADSAEYKKCINGANIKRFYVDEFNGLTLSFKKDFLNQEFCYKLKIINNPEELIINKKKNYSSIFELKFTDKFDKEINIRNPYYLSIKSDFNKYNSYALYIVNAKDNKLSEINFSKQKNNYYEVNLNNSYLNIGIFYDVKKVSFSKIGYATYYGTTDGFHGKKTASGEVFDRNKLTAAMNGVKLGLYAKVTNLANKKEIIVKINDRIGTDKNIIDLSSSAFKEIANLSTGRIKVKVEIYE